ncbi:MAG: SDR family oxidoreductase [Syntrophales bacterium]|jgi:NAD(P)-dependent dehydrogenase (short-subunit alcohol dehydrogenase family)|nr:SDR family oxidoreductase [Syntrophales bacterium]MDY0045632.1 SDR family NAD(P)-dependent oxidoreductase [Syntrophales bacterium]
MRLKDRVALVTGGGGGLGEAISLCLAKEGAHVAVSDLRIDAAEKVASLVRGMGRKSIALQTDVRFADQCRDSIATAIREMGGLDILVCNAGVGGYSPDRDPDKLLTIENITDEDWDMVIDVNLKGVFLCNREAIPHFKKQRSGKIINISSIGGRMPLDFLAHYDASKAGVITLTQAVAMHMARYNVNVNSVCPGLIKTDMGAGMAELLSKSHPVFRGMTPDQVFSTLVKNSVRKRTPQTAEDIGNAVVFLASDEAKEIVGQSVNVCGGMYFS